MVQIRALPRVHVGHQVQHAVPLHHAAASLHGDVVPRLHGELRVHLDVRVGHDHVAHLAGAHIVHIAHAGSLGQRAADDIERPASVVRVQVLHVFEDKRLGLLRLDDTLDVDAEDEELDEEDMGEEPLDDEEDEA